MHNITFQQIDAFLNIARFQSLSLAADAMYISQPALSKMLQRFEKAVDAALFVRGKHGMELTAEGAYLYRTIEPLYADINKTIEAIGTVSPTSQKTLRIIEPDSYDIADDFAAIKKYVRRFESAHFDVDIIESLGNYKEILHELEHGETHFAFVQEFVLHGMKNVSFKRVSPFRLFIAMSADHPLASRDFALEELGGEVFYQVPMVGEKGDQRLMLKRCRAMGFEPKRIEFVSNFNNQLHKVATKKGLSICGKFSYAGDSAELRYIPLPEFEDDCFVVVAYRPDNLSNEARQLLDLIPGDIVRKSG